MSAMIKEPKEKTTNVKISGIRAANPTRRLHEDSVYNACLDKRQQQGLVSSVQQVVIWVGDELPLYHLGP